MVKLEQLDLNNIGKVFIRKTELIPIIREMLNDPSYGILSMEMILNAMRDMDREELLDFTCLLNPFLLNSMLTSEQIKLQKAISESLKLVKSIDIGIEAGNTFKEDKDEFIDAILECKQGLKEDISANEVEGFINNLEVAKTNFMNSLIPEIDEMQLSRVQYELYDLIKEYTTYCDSLIIGLTPGKIFEWDKDSFKDIINSSYRGLTKKFLYDNDSVYAYIANLQNTRDKVESRIIGEHGFVFRGYFYGNDNSYNPDPENLKWIPVTIFNNKYWISFSDIPKEVTSYNEDLEAIYGYFNPNTKTLYTYYTLPANILNGITVKKATAWDGNCYGETDLSGEIINLTDTPYYYVSCISEYHEANYEQDIKVAGNYIKCAVEKLDNFPTKKSIFKKIFNAEGIITFD